MQQSNLVNAVVEQPRGVVPVCLIVDDPAPAINPLYYYRLQVDGANYEQHEPAIPFDFLQDFVDVCAARGIRGKFSIVPYPAGLGSILDGWDGCDRAEALRWLALVRTRLVGDWDITPEIMTHTRALDLATHSLLDQSEQAWMAQQPREVLTEYMSAATTILREAGFVSDGITQPVEFKGSLDDYAHATLAAVRAVGGPDVTFCFVNENAAGPPYDVPELLLLDREQRQAVVNIQSNCPEHFWATQQPWNRTAEQVADLFITADGTSGRLVEMIAHRAWVLMVCHWQSLFSDGSRAGLRGLDLAVQRLSEQYGSCVRWMTTGEIARYRAATETCTIETWHEEGTLTITFVAVIPCPDFTVSLALVDDAPCHVELRAAGDTPSVLMPIAPDAPLEPGTWRRDGDRAMFCFALRRGQQQITLRPE